MLRSPMNLHRWVAHIIEIIYKDWEFLICRIFQIYRYMRLVHA